MIRLSAIRKPYFVVAGSLLLATICYELAFKKTFEAWQTHVHLAQEALQASDISTAPVYLARKNSNLDQIINTYKMDSVNFRNNVVNKIADLAEQQKVKFTIIPADDPLYHTPRFILQKLDFEGDFFSLLKLSNQLQETSGIGMLRSVSWKAKKLAQNDARDKKLVLEVYMEISR